MLRITSYLAVLFITMGLGLSAKVMAFTLQLTPIPSTTPPADLTERRLTDLPTPQFFRFVVTPAGVALALETQRPIPSETTTRLQETGVPDLSPTVPQASQARPSTPPRYLSGVETLLLRQTQIVGDRQQD